MDRMGRVKPNPIRNWLLRARVRIRDTKWWFLHRLHPKHRYHIIKLRSRYHNEGGPGWRDRDHVLLLAAFKIFEDFMEQERPFKVICYYMKDDGTGRPWDQLAVRNEMIRLHSWWKYGRQYERELCENMMAFSDNYKPRWLFADHEEAMNGADFEFNQASRMLHRLINIRGQLWT